VELNQIHRCDVCGNMVGAVHAGKGQLACCGQPMRLLEAKKEEEGKEKHLPVIEHGENVRVKVGSVPHPMEDNHYIEWIEVMVGDDVYRRLKPGDKPEAEFEVKGKVGARAYCNVHGLWTEE